MITVIHPPTDWNKIQADQIENRRQKEEEENQTRERVQSARFLCDRRIDAALREFYKETKIVVSALEVSSRWGNFSETPNFNIKITGTV
jgi:hypothetical protein